MSRPKQEEELPFDDDEVAPLRADDPRPQRVPQYPAGPRRIPRKGSHSGRDRELPSRFSTGEYEDPGHAPVFLYVERGPGAGQLLPVKQGVLILGRASTSDLRLQHPSISRRHAQLTRRGDRLSLKDLGSQNGTFVNHSRLASAEVELHSGDELVLGNALLRVRGAGAPTASPRAASGRSAASLRVGLSPRRLALLSGSLGALAVFFLVLAGVRFVRGGAESAPVPGSEVGESSVPLAEADSAVPSSPEPVPAPEAPRPAPPPQKRTPSAQAIASASLVKRTAGKVPVKGSAAQPAVASPASPAVSVAPATSAPRSDSELQAEASAIARYQAGDVAAALVLAREARLEGLASRLARFEAAWSSALAALEAHDDSTALRQFSLAQQLDQELSQGWSRYAPRIRSALAQVQGSAP